MGLGNGTEAPRAMRQPDGITCGAASLAMVHDLLRRLAGGQSRLGILDLGDLMGTNTTTGTTEKEMAAGLLGLGITAARSVGDRSAERAIGETVATRDLAILRTLTMGYKHWVLAHGRDGGDYLVNDPATGAIRLSPTAIDARIRPRDWEWWRVPRDQVALDVQLLPVVAGSAPTRSEGAAMRRAMEMAGPQMGVPDGDGAAREAAAMAVDWSLSRTVMVDGRPVGFHLLRAGGVRTLLGEGAEVARMAHLRGVESVALAVEPEARGRGYGRLLAAQPGRLGFDYQFLSRPKSLGEPRGRIMAEEGDTFVAVAPVRRAGFRMPDPGAARGAARRP